MTTPKSNDDPTVGFVEYLLSTKPYHTKLLELEVEYVTAESVGVNMSERMVWSLSEALSYLWGWGNNYRGKLGDGTTVDKIVPTQIGSDPSWKQISPGYNHVVSIKTDGTLWVWGFNYYGQLGDGTTVEKHSPIQIGSDTNWKQVESGGVNHSIAIKTDGTLWAWGFNSHGQLGDGTLVDKLVPIQIGTNTNWKQVALGIANTVVVKTNGTLWDWGGNYFGQLGDGTLVDKLVPTQIGSSSNWVQVSTGYNDYTISTRGIIHK